MLSAKPWKTDAVMRLGVSILLCMYAGWLAMTLLDYRPAGRVSFRFYGALAGGFACTGASLFLVRRRWRLEHFVGQLLALWLCLSGTILCGGIAAKLAGPVGPSVAQMVIAALSIQGAGMLWATLFLREHQMNWREAFGLDRGWRRALLLGVMLACIFLPIGYLLQLQSIRLIEAVGHRWPQLQLKAEQQEAVQTAQMAVTWLQRFVLALVTIALAPIAEEVLFRGVLYPWIKQAGFPRLALWGTVFLFALMHFNLASFVPLALLALALTLLYEFTDNLLAPITAHALFNGFNFAMLYLLQEVARSTP